MLGPSTRSARPARFRREQSGADPGSRAPPAPRQHRTQHHPQARPRPRATDQAGLRPGGKAPAGPGTSGPQQTRTRQSAGHLRLCCTEPRHRPAPSSHGAGGGGHTVCKLVRTSPTGDPDSADPYAAPGGKREPHGRRLAASRGCACRCAESSRRPTLASQVSPKARTRARHQSPRRRHAAAARLNSQNHGTLFIVNSD